MRASISFCSTVVAVVFVLALCDPLAAAGEGGQVMLWMCLQRCGGTPPGIAENLLQIAEHPNIFTSVSYEAYNLGANSTLVINTDITNVEPELRLLGWYFLVPLIPFFTFYFLLSSFACSPFHFLFDVISKKKGFKGSQ